MGSPSGETGRDNDETQHQVTLTKGFYMQTTEVTQGQWMAVMGNNPSYFKNCGNDCPVEQVSWNDVQEFIRRLNQKEGGSSYRLPTEAEWEYAARAGTITPFNTGNCLSTDQANYDGNYPLSGCSKGEYRKTTNESRSLSHRMHGVFTTCTEMSGNGSGLERGLSIKQCYRSYRTLFGLGPGLSRRQLAQRRQGLPFG